MVSILIPVYNFDIRELVYKLHGEIENIQDAEILVLDDKSKQEDIELNSEIEKFSKVQFLKNPENLGRSKTRNKLAEKAKNKCLIFLDGDTIPVSENFVKTYLHFFSAKAILFGGIKYSNEKPINKVEYLRWFYGKKREEISVREREKQANRLFMTGNFCIDKTLFDEVKFDEKITQYGHEDTLFAYEMAKKDIFIKHIDNPVFHIGLETGNAFLKKTSVAVENMHYLNNQGYGELLETVRLWQFYKKTYFLRFFYRILFLITKPIFIKNLTGKNPKLLFFDLYKLFALAYFENK